MPCAWRISSVRFGYDSLAFVPPKSSFRRSSHPYPWAGPAALRAGVERLPEYSPVPASIRAAKVRLYSAARAVFKLHPRLYQTESGQCARRDLPLAHGLDVCQRGPSFDLPRTDVQGTPCNAGSTQCELLCASSASRLVASAGSRAKLACFPRVIARYL